jgi:hypothetical protein
VFSAPLIFTAVDEGCERCLRLDWCLRLASFSRVAPGGVGSDRAPFTLEATVKDKKGGLLEPGTAKKPGKHKKGDKIAFVKVCLPSTLI